MDTLHEEVQEVFRDVFDDDQLVLTEAATAADVDGWDSLNHVNLIIALEKRFGIKFANAEISRLKGDDQNVGSLVELVRRKGKREG
jgi:acyl carrier protein